MKTINEICANIFSIFKHESIQFGLLTTALYLIFYRHVIIRYEFQLAGCLTFAISVLFWQIVRNNRPTQLHRVIAFSIAYGLIHYFLILMVVTILPMQKMSLFFMHRIFSYFVREYIVTGVMGVDKSIAMCLISFNIVKMIESYRFDSNFNYKGNTISIVHSLLGTTEIYSNGVLIAKKRRLYFLKRNLCFQTQIENMLVEGLVEIKCYPFNCKNEVKLSIDNVVVSDIYYDLLGGVTLLDSFVYAGVAIITLTNLESIFRPRLPKPNTDAKEVAVCFVFLFCALVSYGIGAIAAYICNKVVTPYFNKRHRPYPELLADIQ